MARPTKAAQEQKAKELAEKKLELAGKGKKVVAKTKALAIEPDIKKLEAAFNESQGLGTIPNTEIEEPVKYKAGEFVDNGNTDLADPTAGSNESDILDNDEIYRVPDKIEEPLDGNTIKRDYAQNPGGPAQQPITDGGAGGNLPPKNPPVNTEPILPETPPIQPTVANPPGGTTTSGAQPNSQQPGATQPQPKQPSDPVLDDISPSQKKKAAEKTADALLKTYSNILPIVPKWMASYNIPKFQRAEMRGELDLKLKVNAEGMRVMDYLQQTNSHVEIAYVVTPEMIEEVKGPLVEVLMEKDIALSATDRLLLAVGQQLALFMMSAGKQWQQNNATMEQFKAFHEENKKNGAPPPSSPTQPGNPNPNPTNTTQPVNNPIQASATPEPKADPKKGDNVVLDDLLKQHGNAEQADILEEGKGFTLYDDKNVD